MIKLIDKNHAIYTQNRTGLHGKNFKIYKFTTMKNGGSNKDTVSFLGQQDLQRIQISLEHIRCCARH